MTNMASEHQSYSGEQSRTSSYNSSYNSSLDSVYDSIMNSINYDKNASHDEYFANPSHDDESTTAAASTKRQRKLFTYEQRDFLETAYKNEKYPRADVIRRLSGMVDTEPRRVATWFQNRRMKDKKNVKKFTTSSPQTCMHDVHQPIRNQMTFSNPNTYGNAAMAPSYNYQSYGFGYNPQYNIRPKDYASHGYAWNGPHRYTPFF